MANNIGLDIGTSTIKLVVGDESKVKRIGLIPNRFGKMLTLMTNSEKIQLVDDIKKMMSEIGVRESGVVASVPESLAFSKTMIFPRMSMPELATAIKWELDQSVPFPPNEVESSWSVFEKNSLLAEDKVGAYVVAVPTKISELYVQLFELIGIEPVRLENEAVPLLRSYANFLEDESPTFVIDFGNSGTKIILASKQMVFNNYFFSVGGSALTKMIMDNFGLPFDQAEQYKRTYGFQQNQLEGKLYNLMKPVFDNFASEIRKMMLSYRNDYGDSKIGKMIVVGGGSFMTGLIPYMSTAFEGMEVSVGNAFESVSVDSEYVNLGPVFGLAFGLSF